MKNVTFPLALITMFMAGTLFTSCETPAKKAEDAKANVQDAKKDLAEAQNDANAASQKAIQAEEWKAFKSESEMKITDNENRIVELKAKMKTSGKVMDKLYEEKIANLEQRNKELKSRMEVYEKGHSDWDAFKREFNHDMDELGQAFKDLTVNNKK